MTKGNALGTIKVMSAGAVQAMVTALGAEFERETGHKIELNFNTVGSLRARQLFMLSDPVDARQCLDFGLVDKVVPDAELGARAQALCERLARAPTASMAGIKQLCEGAARRNLHEQMALEKSLIETRARSSDASEGVQAFLEKRAPRFSGR